MRFKAGVQNAMLTLEKYNIQIEFIIEQSTKSRFTRKIKNIIDKPVKNSFRSKLRFCNHPAGLKYS